MARPGRLANPPIKEALVDIRIKTDRPVEQAAVKAYAATLATRDPYTKESHQYEAQFQGRPGVALNASARDLGFHAMVLKDADSNETRIVQLRVDGFTL